MSMQGATIINRYQAERIFDFTIGKPTTASIIQEAICSKPSEVKREDRGRLIRCHDARCHIACRYKCRERRAPIEPMSWLSAYLTGKFCRIYHMGSLLLISRVRASLQISYSRCCVNGYTNLLTRLRVLTFAVHSRHPWPIDRI